MRQALSAEQALAQEKERLASTLADMTRLEEARRQLLNREHSARAAAEQANRLKDQFLAVVSHELRTPLNAILGWAERHSGKLDEAKSDRASRAILDSAKRQAQLIDELLDVARIDVRQAAPRTEHRRFDRNRQQSAVAVVQPVIEAKRIQVDVETSPGLSTVFGDSARLQQVIWILWSCAISPPLRSPPLRCPRCRPSSPRTSVCRIVVRRRGRPAPARPRGDPRRARIAARRAPRSRRPSACRWRSCRHVRRWIEGRRSRRAPARRVLLLDAPAAAYADVDELRLVGLVEQRLARRGRRSIFYPSSLLRSLAGRPTPIGWPRPARAFTICCGCRAARLRSRTSRSKTTRSCRRRRFSKRSRRGPAD